MRGALLLAAFLLAGCETVPATGPPPPLTRGDLIELSDEALAGRLFGALGADLLVGHRDRDRRARSLHGETLWFWTRPRATDRAGICSAERLIVRLEPALGGMPADSQPLRLRSIDRQLIHIIRDPALARRLSGFEPRELEGEGARCAAANPRRDDTPSDSPWQLMKARELTAELGRAARAGRAPAPIDCTRFVFSGPPTPEAECLAGLARLHEDSVAWTSDCGEAVVLGGPCIRVMAGDWFIYFVMRQGQQVERIIVRGFEDMSQVS